MYVSTWYLGVLTLVDVAKLLADASEDDIRRYQRELQSVKKRTSSDLQHNVYENRMQFIRISKEAEKLKSEMRTLRQLLGELTNTLGQTAPAMGDGVRKHANRSSVANLEAMWNGQLQTLWKRVEGSQKYLPAIAGRHVVLESGKWYELNAATWKMKRPVHLILLNDHLLVAAEKKQRGETRDAKPKGPGHHVAHRCWPLPDVQMADLASRAKMGTPEARQGASHAINVRVGTESFTYAVHAADANDKIAMLSTFRKTVEDLRHTAEAEGGKEIGYFARAKDNVEAADQRASMFVDVDGNQQSIRWIESQLDDLDIDIALRRFDEAVRKVERLKATTQRMRGNAIVQNLVPAKVNERAAKLASVLIKQLVEKNSRMSAVQTHVNWVVRLGFEDGAREAYLEARSHVIKARSRCVCCAWPLHAIADSAGNVYSKATCRTTCTRFPSSTSLSSRTRCTSTKTASRRCSCRPASSGPRSTSRRSMRSSAGSSAASSMAVSSGRNAWIRPMCMQPCSPRSGWISEKWWVTSLSKSAVSGWAWSSRLCLFT